MEEVRYYVGIADEGDKYYIESLEIDKSDYFSTKEACEAAIQKRLKNWAYNDGWTRNDYDIAKVTIKVERI